MGGGTVLPTADMFLLAVLFLGILALAMFGLDEGLAKPKRRQPAARFFCEVDGKGSTLECDPDGTPWRKAPASQVEGRLIRMGRPGREQPVPEAMRRPRAGRLFMGISLKVSRLVVTSRTGA